MADFPGSLRSSHSLFVLISPGDVEMVLDLETNTETVISTATTTVLVLNTKNYERLVTKKHPFTVTRLTQWAYNVWWCCLFVLFTCCCSWLDWFTAKLLYSMNLELSIGCNHYFTENLPLSKLKWPSPLFNGIRLRNSISLKRKLNQPRTDTAQSIKKIITILLGAKYFIMAKDCNYKILNSDDYWLAQWLPEIWLNENR